MSETPSVLTIIAPAGENSLNNNHLEAIKSALNLSTEAEWLANGTAADLHLTTNWTDKAAIKALNDQVSDALKDNPFDYAIQPSQNRRKKLLISDMDSTIICEECIDEIAFMAGIKPKIAAITERAMRGEIEFDAALNERVGLLKGLPVSSLDTVIDQRIHLSKGARTLVQTMAKNKAYCALVSGGFTFFTDRIAKLTGFHTTRANTLEIQDEKLTGKVIPPILGSAAKKQALNEFISEFNLNRNDTLAVGDGANDLEMINEAGLGIAYRAKPIVASEADAAINHTDLTSLLYIQGYKQAEFVTD